MSTQTSSSGTSTGDCDISDQINQNNTPPSTSSSSSSSSATILPPPSPRPFSATSKNVNIQVTPSDFTNNNNNTGVSGIDIQQQHADKMGDMFENMMRQMQQLQRECDRMSNAGLGGFRQLPSSSSSSPFDALPYYGNNNSRSPFGPRSGGGGGVCCYPGNNNDELMMIRPGNNNNNDDFHWPLAPSNFPRDNSLVPTWMNERDYAPVSWNKLKRESLPKMQMRDENDKVVVYADLPGLTKQDVNIHVDNGCLTISGNKSSEKKNEGHGYFMEEKCQSRFHRSFPLPQGVKEEDIKANFDKGILTVTLPKQTPAIDDKGRRPIKID